MTDNSKLGYKEMLTLITEVAIVQICRLTVGKDGSEVGVTINVRFTCTSSLINSLSIYKTEK
jgi:hypothetical protein